MVGHGIILMLSANMGINTASALFWLALSWISSWTPHLLPERLIAELYHRSLITGLPGLHDVPLAVRQKLWFKHDRAPTYFVKMSDSGWLWCPGRRMGYEGTTAWPPPLPYVTPMKSLKWGQLKEYVFAVPPRTILDIVARRNRAVTVANANKVCSKEYLVACCHLPWNW